MTLSPLWNDRLQNVVQIQGSTVRIVDRKALRNRMEALARWAALGTPEEKAQAQYLIRCVAQEMGAIPASIFTLYQARGRGEVPPTFTVPALNLRALPFLAARQVFRVMQELNAGTVIFEISRSEMGYTAQRPGEYAAQILAAAVAEGYQGPVFLQGDHFQVSPKRYREAPEEELQALRELIHEALAAGFFQIDIDASTLVDLDRPTVEEQQRENFTLTAQLSAYVRAQEPQEITVALGGEIGEVGGHNTTVEELRAFMKGYRQILYREAPSRAGLSKISVQTGTAHGGVVLPDGTLAEVRVDFERLRELSRVAREEFGLAGAVQHGASTLPLDLFDKFPQYETCEIHLATQFMNILFDRLPSELREEMYAYLETHHQEEWNPEWTPAQFHYKLRKKALGPFKEALWSLPEETKEEIAFAWTHTFRLLFTRLGIRNTREIVENFVPLVPIEPRLETYEQAEIGGTATQTDASLDD